MFLVPVRSGVTRADGDAQILEQERLLEQGWRGRLLRGLTEQRIARAVQFGEISNARTQRVVLPPPHDAGVWGRAARTLRGVTQLLFLGW